MKVFRFENPHSRKELEFIKEIGVLFEIDDDDKTWRIGEKKRGSRVAEAEKRRATSRQLTRE